MKAPHVKVCGSVKEKKDRGRVIQTEEQLVQLCEAAETPESRNILQQSLMLKVPERLFISWADGRLASSCWPSPSLPLFIE